MSDVELKKWAFEKVVGWGTLEPVAGNPEKKEFRAWDLNVCMEKADELVAWALAPPPEEDKT